MNKQSKNLICSILSLGMLSGTLTTYAQTASDVSGTKFEEPINVLSSLNIMIGDGNGEFRPNDNLTRAEVAKIAIHAMGIESAVSSSQSKFPDVSDDYWANGYINLASSMGIVIGDDNGNFRPLDPITYAEAMTIMVRVAGYKPSAEQKGGFPSGYILVGSENAMNKNVEGSMHSPITRGNVAYLTLNTLKTKMMEQTNYGGNIKYEITDKTLLSDRHKVKEMTGRVTAIATAAISGASNLHDGQVKIDDKVYEADCNVSNLLGYNVTYYLKNHDTTDESIILAYPTQGKNDAVTITAEQFDKVTSKNSNKSISYYTSENSSKKQTAQLSENVSLIYNGRHSTLSDSLLNIENKFAKMTLLDTNSDRKYDIVFVTNYYNMQVENVSSSGKITNKNGSKTITLDENVSYTISRGSERLSPSDIRRNDILSIAESADGKLLEINVSNRTETGKITAVSDGKYYIGDTGYKAAADFNEELKIGNHVTLYLDFYGNIAVTDKSASKSTEYGYMTKAYQSDETVKFKLLTTNGKEQLFDGAAKIKLNGSSAKPASAVLKEISQNNFTTQLVTYKLSSDGKISEINTAKSGAVGSDGFTLNHTLKDAEYNAASSKLSNVKITDKTIIFNITENTDKYSVELKSFFEDKQSYNALAYDVDDEFCAGAVVVTKSNLYVSPTENIAIVKEVAKGTTSSGEISDILIALTNTGEVKMFAESDDILKKEDGKTLKSGDIVQIKKTSDDKVAQIRLLFDSENKNTEFSKSPADELETVYGKVTKTFASSVNVSVNDGSETNYTIPSDVLVYKVDTSSKPTISKASINDIQVFDASDAERVFIKLYKHAITEIVIIK